MVEGGPTGRGDLLKCDTDLKVLEKIVSAFHVIVFLLCTKQSTGLSF
jgi:hypothetical protein